MTSHGAAKISRDGLWQVSCNIFLALLYACFAYSHGTAFFTSLRVSSGLLLLKETFDVVFFLARKGPTSTSRSPFAWLVAFGATFMPLFLRPVSNAQDTIFAADLLMICGGLLQIYAILSLNTSFGIVPAQRGLKTKGMYRVVRHPLYTSYFISQLGYLFNNMSAYNLALLTIAALLQIVRIKEEERFLVMQDGYRDYMSQTKYRLLPGVY